MAYTEPQERKQEKSERARGDRDENKFIDSRFKKSKLQDSGKHEEGKTLHKLQVCGMNDDLWDRVRGLGCEIWKGCE